MDIHGVEIDKVTVGVLCDDDLCLVKPLEQPTIANTIAGNSNSPPDKWNIGQKTTFHW